MKKSLITFAAFVAVVTPALAQWSIEYMSQPRYNMLTARFPTHAVFVTNSWERYDASTDSWTNGLLSEARIGITAANAGTKAYFAGGKKGPFTDYIYVKTIDIYDDAANTWSRGTLSVAREVGGAGTLGQQLFFAGGRSAIRMHNTVDIFNVSTGTRSTARLSKARTDLAVGAAGNKIVFAGGWFWDFNYNIIYSNAVDIYDNTTGLWTRATLSQKRDAVSVAVVGNKILFAGGFISTGSGISKNVDVYDVTTNTWTTTFMSVPRYAPTINVVGNKVYFAGSGNGVNTIDVYDVATNSWSVLTMPYTLTGMCGVVINNQIFYAGGYDPLTFAVYDFVQIYDISSNTWSIQYLSEARAGITSVDFGNIHLFVGGLTRVIYPPIGSATVDMYTAP